MSWVWITLFFLCMSRFIKNNKITYKKQLLKKQRPIFVTWPIHHFEVLWACLSMPDHAHLKCLHKFVVFINVQTHTKNNFITQLFELLLIHPFEALWAYWNWPNKNHLQCLNKLVTFNRVISTKIWKFDLTPLVLLKILVIYHFKVLWVCLNVPEQVQWNI